MNFTMRWSLFWRRKSSVGVHQKCTKELLAIQFQCYVDGHHSKLAERSCGIPVVFKQFTSFNVPERSKHRKRANTSLSADVLRSHSHRLFVCLQAGFWDRASWKSIKAEVELLARMVQKLFRSYLRETAENVRATQLTRTGSYNWKFHVRSLPTPTSYS